MNVTTPVVEVYISRPRYYLPSYKYDAEQDDRHVNDRLNRLVNPGFPYACAESVVSDSDTYLYISEYRTC